MLCILLFIPGEHFEHRLDLTRERSPYFPLFIREFHLCLSDIDMSEALFHLRTSTKACVIALGRAFGVFVAAVSRFTLRVSLSIRVCVAGDSLK